MRSGYESLQDLPGIGGATEQTLVDEFDITTPRGLKDAFLGSHDKAVKIVDKIDPNRIQLVRSLQNVPIDPSGVSGATRPWHIRAVEMVRLLRLNEQSRDNSAITGSITEYEGWAYSADQIDFSDGVVYNQERTVFVGDPAQDHAVFEGDGTGKYVHPAQGILVPDDLDSGDVIYAPNEQQAEDLTVLLEDYVTAVEELVDLDLVRENHDRVYVSTHDEPHPARIEGDFATVGIAPRGEESTDISFITNDGPTGYEGGDTPVTEVPGIGSTTGRILNRRGIDSAEELTHSYLSHYADELTEINNITADRLNDGLLPPSLNVDTSPLLSPWKLAGMAFLRKFSARYKTDSFVTDVETTMRRVPKLKVTPGDVKWDEFDFITGKQNSVALVAPDGEPPEEISAPIEIDGFAPITDPDDGGVSETNADSAWAYVFYASDGSHTTVETDRYNDVESLLGLPDPVDTERYHTMIDSSEDFSALSIEDGETGVLYQVAARVPQDEGKRAVQKFVDERASGTGHDTMTNNTDSGGNESAEGSTGNSGNGGVSLPDWLDSGRADALVVRTGSDRYGERYRLDPLSDEHRANPDQPITPRVRDDFNGPEYNTVFAEGEVVGWVRVSDSVKRGQQTEIRAKSYDRADEKIKDRVTDEDGNLSLERGVWQPVHIRALMNLQEGDVVSGWSTPAPFIESNDYGAVVGWDDEGEYVYRPDSSNAIVYRWDSDSQDIEPSRRDDHSHIGTQQSFWVYRPPEGDEVVGTEPQSDESPGPMDVILKSDLPDDIEYQPYLRSYDELEEYVDNNTPVWVRQNHGALWQTEFSGVDVTGGKEAYVEHYRLPSDNNTYTLPTSKIDSDLDLVAAKPGADDDDTIIWNDLEWDTPTATRIGAEGQEAGEVTTETDHDRDELYEIRSPNRPLPRGAKKELYDEYGAVEDLDADDDMGRGDGVLTTQLPPEDFRDEWELRVVRDATVAYETDRDESLEIYEDPSKVLMDGHEAQMSPVEAVEKAEERREDGDWKVVSGDPSDVDGYDPDATTDETKTVHVSGPEPEDESFEIEVPLEVNGYEDTDDRKHAGYLRWKDDPILVTIAKTGPESHYVSWKNVDAGAGNNAIGSDASRTKGTYTDKQEAIDAAIEWMESHDASDLTEDDEDLPNLDKSNIPDEPAGRTIDADDVTTGGDESFECQGEVGETPISPPSGSHVWCYAGHDYGDDDQPLYKFTTEDSRKIGLQWVQPGEDEAVSADYRLALANFEELASVTVFETDSRDAMIRATEMVLHEYPQAEWDGSLENYGMHAQRNLLTESDYETLRKVASGTEQASEDSGESTMGSRAETPDAGDFGFSLAPNVAEDVENLEPGDELVVNDWKSTPTVTRVTERDGEGFDGRLDIVAQANGYDYVITYDKWLSEVKMVRMADKRQDGGSIDLDFFGVVPDDETDDETDTSDDRAIRIGDYVVNPDDPAKSLGEYLLEIRSDMGNLAANQFKWMWEVREWEANETTLDNAFSEVEAHAGAVLVTLNEDEATWDEEAIDAVETGFTEYDIPISGVREGKDGETIIDIEATRFDQPLGWRDRAEYDNTVGVYRGRPEGSLEQDPPEYRDYEPADVPEEVAGWTLEENEGDTIEWHRPDDGDSQNANIDEWHMRVSSFMRPDGETHGWAVMTAYYSDGNFFHRTKHQEGGFGGDRSDAIDFALSKMRDRPYSDDEDEEETLNIDKTDIPDEPAGRTIDLDTESEDLPERVEPSPYDFVEDLGFFAYSGSDGDLFRKNGLGGWRISLATNGARIQRKNDRGNWQTVLSYRDSQDEMVDARTSYGDISKNARIYLDSPERAGFFAAVETLAQSEKTGNELEMAVKQAADEAENQHTSSDEPAGSDRSIDSEDLPDPDAMSREDMDDALEDVADRYEDWNVSHWPSDGRGSQSRVIGELSTVLDKEQPRHNKTQATVGHIRIKDNRRGTTTWEVEAKIVRQQTENPETGGGRNREVLETYIDKELAEVGSRSEAVDVVEQFMGFGEEAEPSLFKRAGESESESDDGPSTTLDKFDVPEEPVAYRIEPDDVGDDTDDSGGTEIDQSIPDTLGHGFEQRYQDDDPGRFDFDIVWSNEDVEASIRLSKDDGNWSAAWADNELGLNPEAYEFIVSSVDFDFALTRAKNKAEDLGDEGAESDDSESGSAESEDTGPQDPRRGGDVAASVLYGGGAYSLPEPWDGWREVSVGSPGFDEPATLDTEYGDGEPVGEHVAYLDGTRQLALVVEGSAVTNKWNLLAIRYEEPLPEEHDENALLYGPGGDGRAEKAFIGRSNRITAPAQVLADEAPIVGDVVEKVGEPQPVEADDTDDTTATDDEGTDDATFYQDTKTLLKERYGESPPKPQDDPNLKYLHPGKEYNLTAGEDRSVTIRAYAPEAGPDIGGIVILEADDEGFGLRHEFQHDQGGVSKQVLESYIPDENNRAVYSGTFIMGQIRELEIFDEFAQSYADIYYDYMDEVVDQQTTSDDGDEMPDVSMPDQIEGWSLIDTDPTPPTWVYGTETEIPNTSHEILSVMQKGASGWQLYLGIQDDEGIHLNRPQGSYDDKQDALNQAESIIEDYGESDEIDPESDRPDFETISSHDELIDWAVDVSEEAVETHDMDIDLSHVVWGVFQNDQATRMIADTASAGINGASVGAPIDWGSVQDQISLDNLSFEAHDGWTPDHVLDNRIRLNWDAFQEISKSEAVGAIKHELVHVEQQQKYGTTNHRNEFKRRAREIDAPVKGPKWSDDPYRLECAECGDMVGGRKRKSKTVKQPTEYRTDCCDAPMRSYDTETGELIAGPEPESSEGAEGDTGDSSGSETTDIGPDKTDFPEEPMGPYTIDASDVAAQRDDEDDGEYDPMSEYDDPDEEVAYGYGHGGGRRKTLDAIESKDRLDEVQSFKSIDEMANALREISLVHRDGNTYLAHPEDAIDTLERVYNDLPEDARQHFLNDDALYRRINAARRQFNDFLGKLKRMKEMPSPVEAGPANYPAKKARDLSRYKHEASEELDEKIKRVEKAARGGARQRALEAIGSSVAEQNEQRRESQREAARDVLEPGDLVLYRSPNLHVGAVLRVNEKSVRVQRKNPYQESDFSQDGEYYQETVKFDSSGFYGKIPPEELPELNETTEEKGGLDRGQTVPDNLFDAQMQMLGEEWLVENAEHAAEPPEDRPPIWHQTWLSEVTGIGQATEDDLREIGVSNLGDAVEAYENRGQTDTWAQIVDTVPTSSAVDNLKERIGAGEDDDTEPEDDGMGARKAVSGEQLDRFEAAVEEPMFCERVGDDTVEVTTLDGTHEVDLASEKGCSCKDAEINDVRCKHHIRASMEAGMIPVAPEMNGMTELAGPDAPDEPSDLPDLSKFPEEPMEPLGRTINPDAVVTSDDATEAEESDPIPDEWDGHKLTTEFDERWFADDFQPGDLIHLRVGGEKALAEVWETEPADGTIILDMSRFENVDSVDRLETFADNSSTGPDYISHDFDGFAFLKVSYEAGDGKPGSGYSPVWNDAEPTHVVTDDGIAPLSTDDGATGMVEETGEDDDEPVPERIRPDGTSRPIEDISEQSDGSWVVKLATDKTAALVEAEAGEWEAWVGADDLTQGTKDEAIAALREWLSLEGAFDPDTYSVNDLVQVTHMGGGGATGDVTSIDGDELTLKIGDYRHVVNLDTAQSKQYYNGKKRSDEPVGAIEILEHAEDRPETRPVVEGHDRVRQVKPGEDDLSDVLEGRGLNALTAQHLADNYESLEDVKAAVRSADDLTELPGVGDETATQVAAVFEKAGDSTDDTPSSDAAVNPAGENPNIGTGDPSEIVSDHDDFVGGDMPDYDDLPDDAQAVLNHAWRGYKATKEKVKGNIDTLDDIEDAARFMSVINAIHRKYRIPINDFYDLEDAQHLLQNFENPGHLAGVLLPRDVPQEYHELDIPIPERQSPEETDESGDDDSDGWDVYDPMAEFEGGDE